MSDPADVRSHLGRLLRISEVATILQTDEGDVRELIITGQLRRVRTPAGTRVPLLAVAVYLLQQATDAEELAGITKLIEERKRRLGGGDA